MFLNHLNRWLTFRNVLLCGLAALAGTVATPRQARAQSIWINAGSGNWDNAANWNTAFFPNSMDADAVFNAVNPAANSIITLSAVDITVGTIQINNPTSSLITNRTITFNDGTAAQIQFNSGSWTIASNIVLDSNLTVTGASGGTLSGVIANGAASNLTKSGAGTLTLNGANTFTGTTRIDDGVLALNAVNALGSTSSVALNGDSVLRLSAAGDEVNDTAALTLNDTSILDLNGNFEALGSLAGGAGTAVTMGAGTLDTGANNASTTYNGVISGTGSLVQRGAGTFSLGGANTYTGTTTVAGGRLDVNGSVNSNVTVNNAATLGGTGSVRGVVVNAGGTLAPGNSIGTLTISGPGTPAYTQMAGSTDQVEINNLGTVAGVNNDLVDLTNAAATVSLAGTVAVQDTTGGGFYEAGTTYTILRTANPIGVLGQSYDAVTDNLAIRDAVLIHNLNNVQVQLQRIAGDFAANSMTRNQRAVGTVLDAVSPLAVGDLGFVLDQMVVLPNAQKKFVLDQLSGEMHASVAGLTVQTTSHFVDIVSRRLRTNTPAAVGMYGATLAPGAAMLMGNTATDGLQRVSLTDSGDFVVRAQGLAAPGYGSGYSDMGAVPFAAATPSLGGAWISGYGVGGDVDGDGNGNPYDYSLGGTAFGIEQHLSPILLAGLVGGYSHADVDMDRPRGDADIDSYHAGVYAHVTEGIAYASGVVAYGFQNYDTTRRIVFPGINRTARADYDGHELTAYIEKGLNLSWSGWRVQPLVGLQYIGLKRDAFRETGAGALNLNVIKDHVDSLRGSAGGRIAPELPPGFYGAIVPEIRGRFVHEFLDDDQALSANFAGAPGANFAVKSTQLGRNFGIVGAGLNAQLSPAVNLFLDYDFQFSSQLESHAGSGGLEFLW